MKFNSSQAKPSSSCGLNRRTETRESKRVELAFADWLEQANGNQQAKTLDLLRQLRQAAQENNAEFGQFVAYTVEALDWFDSEGLKELKERECEMGQELRDSYGEFFNWPDKEQDRFLTAVAERADRELCEIA